MCTHLYSYCENNPIVYSDPTGYLKQCWYNKVSFVAKVIDAIILIVSTGKSVIGITAMRKFIKNNSQKLVKEISKQLLKYIGSITSAMVSAAIDFVSIIIGNSIGDLIAKALDYADPIWKKGYQRSNGYILN